MGILDGMGILCGIVALLGFAAIAFCGLQTLIVMIPAAPASETVLVATATGLALFMAVTVVVKFFRNL